MLVFGLLLLGLQRSHAAAREESTRHNAGLAAVAELYLTLRHTESSQRGYLLTGNASFLEEFHASGAAAEDQLSALPRFAVTAVEVAAVAQIDAMARTRLEASRQVLNVAAAEGPDVAATLIAEGAGRRAMMELQTRLEAARTTVASMQEEQTARLNARYRWVSWFIAGGTGFAALAGLLTGTALTRYGRQRDRAVRWLEGANEQLREQADELEAQALELELQTRELEESATELAARGEHFQALLEEGADMIFEVDPRGLVRYASPGAGRRLGLEAGALTGRPFADLFHPDDRDGARGILDRLLSGAQDEADLDCQMQAADGNWRQVVGRARNLLARAAIGSIVVNCRDVTQERFVEAQLRHAQKMEAIGQLAGGVAHDLNNLLTSISGYATFAAESVPPDSPARSDMQEVIRSAELAASLTRQLLTFSRKQVTNPQVVELNGVLADSVGMLRRLLGSSVEMVVRPDPGVGAVLIDDGQLRQVIMNLAVNARDAMPDGGRLFIETESRTVDAERAERHGVRPGAYTVLGVTDDGEGMPAEVQQRIFEPFYTTKEQGRGTGLGLSTVYGIVRQAGGYVWVYSEPGGGTTFRIYLPVAGSGEEGQGAAATRVVPRRPAHETLLLVEDDEAVRAFAERVLRREGYRVVTAPTAEDALLALEAASEPVSLVITDVIMPGMSGAALGREIERRDPGMHVLYTSGYPREEMSWRGSIPPNVSFIAKPYSAADLLAAIGAILDDGADHA